MAQLLAKVQGTLKQNEVLLDAVVKAVQEEHASFVQELSAFAKLQEEKVDELNGKVLASLV